MKIYFFDIFKSIDNKRKFIILLKLDLPRNIKLSFKDDKIFIVFLENVKNPEQITDEITQIIKKCFERCNINYIRVKGNFYISKNNEYVYTAELEINSDKLIDTIKYKLAYDEISLKDLYHLL